MKARNDLIEALVRFLFFSGLALGLLTVSVVAGALWLAGVL